MIIGGLPFFFLTAFLFFPFLLFLRDRRPDMSGETATTGDQTENDAFALAREGPP